MATSPSGGCISSTSPSLRPTSSSDAAPKAMHIRRSVPNWLIRSGCEETSDVLEQQRGAAGLDDAVVDLRDLELGIDLGGDANELTLALEQRDPRAQVRGRSHRGQSRSPVVAATAYAVASSRDSSASALDLGG